MSEWISVDDRMPPRRYVVAVLVDKSFIPHTGYWKDNGDGTFWVVPGMGGEVEWWSDCLPRPYPDEKREEFRRYIEGR